MAGLSTLMKARRPKTGCAGAKPTGGSTEAEHTGSSVYSETEFAIGQRRPSALGLIRVEGLPRREAMLQRIYADDEIGTTKRSRAHCEKRDCSIEFRVSFRDGTLQDVERTDHPVSSRSGEP